MTGSSRSDKNKAPSAPIVVGVDGSDSALAAVGWAAAECARQHVPLRLVHGYLVVTGYPEMVITDPEVRGLLERQGRDWLTEAAAAARATAPDVEVTTELQCSGATGLLVDESKKARLVVIGSRGRGTVTGLLLGSTAVALAAHGHSPVVVVRGTETPDGPVVVGVDGSPTSEAALAFAFETASGRGAALTAVMTTQDFTVDSVYNASRIAIDWAQVEEDGRRLLAQRLAGWQEKYPDVEVHRVVMRDRPARALLRFGAEAQLLVVGSHGHGGFAGMLLGSTSQALVHHAPCPLAIVRTPK
ncbi:Nucleotide-binding universal stress protein, UspA family [Lentzea fradiae]|uniref:Nucleotide-binding universal stress protein, UspA family n=1 Tax=Lentzea fradiae TaxID=200378 RepID=A0A1G8DCP9_9PSEU|nr:universal stress protein [Lentzea fradiae]SDH55512.1 Nucleotide-binding universal stress protein, UspA family [Lentzea fradiae]